jgi:hypothetical protein
MILITSISVQDKLDYHGRRQAYVMELAGPHSPDEFVIEIGEEIYQKLMQVYEANGSSLQGDPVMAELATHPASPPPSATPEEFDSVRRKLIEEESKHSSMVPEEFAGRPLSQDEANLLAGIGVDLTGGSQLGDVQDGDDDGELLDEDADQL